MLNDHMRKNFHPKSLGNFSIYTLRANCRPSKQHRSSHTCQEFQPKKRVCHISGTGGTFPHSSCRNHSTRVPGFVVTGAVMDPHASESLTVVGYICGFLYLCLNKAKVQASGIKWSLMPMCSTFYFNQLLPDTICKCGQNRLGRTESTTRIKYAIDCESQRIQIKFAHRWCRRSSSCMSLLFKFVCICFIRSLGLL